MNEIQYLYVPMLEVTNGRTILVMVQDLSNSQSRQYWSQEDWKRNESNSARKIACAQSGDSVSGP
jgi:hypothetical protein